MNKNKILSVFLSFTLLSQSGAIPIENVNAVVSQSVAPKKVKKISTFKKAIYLTGSVVVVVAGFLGIKKLVSLYSKKNKTKSSSCSNGKTQTPTPAPNKRKLNVDEGCNGGIDNIGNSCYMNAMLQILYDIEEFREFIFSAAKDNCDGINKEDFKKIKAMYAVFKHMSGEQSLDKSALSENIYALGHGGKQDDCKICIFSYWSNIINEFEKINKIDVGEMFSKVYPGNKEITFFELLKNENIDINSHIVGVKFMAWINRVEYNGSVSEKITTEVEPNEVTKDNKNYKLTGVIVHSGNKTESGHYYSYKLNLKNNEWYRYDDSSVTKVKWDDIKNNIFKNATLFLYSEIK